MTRLSTTLHDAVDDGPELDLAGLHGRVAARRRARSRRRAATCAVWAVAALGVGGLVARGSGGPAVEAGADGGATPTTAPPSASTRDVIIAADGGGVGGPVRGTWEAPRDAARCAGIATRWDLRVGMGEATPDRDLILRIDVCTPKSADEGTGTFTLLAPYGDDVTVYVAGTVTATDGIPDTFSIDGGSSGRPGRFDSCDLDATLEGDQVSGTFACWLGEPGSVPPPDGPGWDEPGSSVPPPGDDGRSTASSGG